MEQYRRFCFLFVQPQNAPHSLSTALDSLYVAYLKVHHFDETYAVLLDYYSLGKKRDIGKVSSCKKELESLSYRIEQIKYGQDNTAYAKYGNSFVQSMLALKGSNPVLPEVLKDMTTKSLMEIYVAIKAPKNPETNRAYNTKAHFCLLCSIGYFPTNNKKASKYIPLLYDSVYTKKQFRMSSWNKLLEELGVQVDINKYITRATAATYYLDPLKIPQLCDDLYDLIQCDDYTPKEQVENEINAYGVLNDPSRFFSDKIYYGIVKAISKKNNSLLIELYSGKEQWIKLRDVSLIKRQQTIIILKANMVGKDVLVTDYLNY